MNKLLNKLSFKTFVLLLLLSLSVSLFAYSCIWIFLPYADQKLARQNLARQTEQFVSRLWTTPQNSSELLFTDFLRRTGAELLLLDRNGQAVSPFTFQKLEKPGSETADSTAVTEIRYPFRFAGSGDEYVLIARYDPVRSDEITTALRKSVPLVTLLILLLSSVSALIFSRHTTKPIVRISRIADRISNLDFTWYCPDLREDEIGILSRSINDLSDKLHAALLEIQRRNDFLEDEILLEKERERQRMLFFSSVSHELKTPIAVVIGQLEGMQAQIGVYRDREKYLARSAEILQSLNTFIQEILLVSHMDMQSEPSAAVDLSGLLETLTADYAEYAQPLAIRFSSEIEPAVHTYGDETLLRKALGNVIGNAVAYSPEHGRVSVRLVCAGHSATLTVFNAGSHIRETDLPHLFEAFYRADQSTSYGSGLGLYITRMILETCQVSHFIENTGNGVMFTAVFPVA